MDAEHLRELIDRLLLLYSELCRRHCQKHSELLPAVQELNARLIMIKRSLSDQQFIMAFVGLSNVGKSTLLNALLGQEVAPRKNRPWSAAPVEYVRGDRYQVDVEFLNTFVKRSFQCSDSNQLLKTLEQYASEAGSSGAVRKVVATVPADLLSESLIVADTPGFGAAQVGQNMGRHDSVLERYLPTVHRVFWVVLFEQGITDLEVQFFNSCLSPESSNGRATVACSDIVVTGSEDTSDADKALFRRTFTDAVGLHLLDFHFVSGRDALEAQKANDRSVYERSGIGELDDLLRDLGDAQNRLTSAGLCLAKLCVDSTSWLASRMPDVRTPIVQRRNALRAIPAETAGEQPFWALLRSAL